MGRGNRRGGGSRGERGCMFMEGGEMGCTLAGWQKGSVDISPLAWIMDFA